MPSFFVNPSKNNLAFAQMLASYTGASPVAFNPNDQGHKDLIDNCVKELDQKRLAIQTIDKNALIGFSIGAVAFGLSYILPVAVIAMAGFAYGAYQLGLRSRAYQDYESALENLITCCKWTLGKVVNEKIVRNENIQKMITALAPLTSEAQLREFIDDRYEGIFVKQAEKSREHTSVLEYELNQEEASLYYKIYGYQQGGVYAIFQGINYAICNAFNYVKHACVSATAKTSEGTSAPQVEPRVGVTVGSAV